MPEDSREDHREEYKDVSANMRMYVGLRFAVLTIFVALTGALMTVTLARQGGFTGGGTAPLEAPLILKIAGASAALLMWLLGERATTYYRALRKRAERLEDLLGYEQYRLHHPGPWLRVIKCHKRGPAGLPGVGHRMAGLGQMARAVPCVVAGWGPLAPSARPRTAQAPRAVQFPGLGKCPLWN
jgi:hypothetical protein